MALRSVVFLLACSRLAPTVAQVPSPVEITTANFAVATGQPYAWLLHLEMPANAQSTAAAQLLRQPLRQLTAYFHTVHKEKGVRIGHVDMQRSIELKRLLCEVLVRVDSTQGAVPQQGAMQQVQQQVQGAMQQVQQQVQQHI